MAIQGGQSSLPSQTSPPMVPRQAPEAFDRFWAAYPKRDGANPKHPASKKFLALVKSGIDVEAIVAGANGYRAECDRKQQTGTPYVAMATTWLNQHRWEDYQRVIEPPKRKIP
jgi:hypothetical protein